MSPKEQATLDIMADLKNQNKCFIAFRRELNPIMRRLVREQLYYQGYKPKTKKSQLMAHCFFCHSTGEVKYNNYSKYYE